MGRSFHSAETTYRQLLAAALWRRCTYAANSTPNPGSDDYEQSNENADGKVLG
jgi:hypothetical protein